MGKNTKTLGPLKTSFGDTEKHLERQPLWRNTNTSEVNNKTTVIFQLHGLQPQRQWHNNALTNTKSKLLVIFTTQTTEIQRQTNAHFYSCDVYKQYGYCESSTSVREVGCRMTCGFCNEQKPSK